MIKQARQQQKEKNYHVPKLPIEVENFKIPVHTQKNLTQASLGRLQHHEMTNNQDTNRSTSRKVKKIEPMLLTDFDPDLFRKKKETNVMVQADLSPWGVPSNTDSP